MQRYLDTRIHETQKATQTEKDKAHQDTLRLIQPLEDTVRKILNDMNSTSTAFEIAKIAQKYKH